MMNHSIDPPRVETLHVKNYRALRDARLEKLTPLTVLLGPNPSLSAPTPNSAKNPLNSLIYIVRNPHFVQ